MSKMNRYSAPEKLAILQEYEIGHFRLVDIYEKYDISERTFDAWRHRYKLYGYEG